MAGVRSSGLLFPRGLMLLDFEEHRLHRRALSVAFKSDPMKSYLAQLDAGIAARVARWKARPGPMLFYPAMKQLTLDLAATSFLGADIGPEVDAITRAFVDMVAASIAPIRQPWPGTQMARGVKGRKRIVAYFSEQIPIRRGKQGQDLFSQLCRATHDDGALLSTAGYRRPHELSDDGRARHLTSSLTSFVAALAANPHWQDRFAQRGDSAGGCRRRADHPGQSRGDAADGNGLQGDHADEAAGALDSAACDPRFQLQGLRDPGRHHGRHQPAVHPSHAGDLARSRDFDPMRSATRRSAPATALPLCRSAAAPICASGCTSPTCRPSALRGISCRISASRCSRASRRTGRCGRSRNRATDCA